MAFRMIPWTLAVLAGLATVPTAPVTQVLPRGTLTGVVSRIDGAPLSGLRLSVKGPNVSSFATVDRQGRFEVGSLPAGLYRVSSETAGLSMFPRPDVAVVVWPNRTTDLPIRLAAGSLLTDSSVLPGATEVTGSVVDQDGSSLPGAIVTLSGDGASRKVTTSVDGRYRFEEPTAGEHDVRVELPGFTAPGTRRVPVVDGRSTTADFVLAAGMGDRLDDDARFARLDRFEAMLSRWLAARPAAYGATIGLVCFCDSGPRRVQVDVSGPTTASNRPNQNRPASIEDVFESVLRYIDRRPYQFSVEYDETFGFPERMVANVRRMTTDDEVEVYVRDFEPAGPVIQADSGVVSGRVVNRAGSPVPGVTLTLTLGGSTNPTPLGQAVTDAEGAFRMVNVAPGVYQVAATMPGFVMANGPTRAVIVWADREANADLWMFAEQRGGRDEDWRQHELGRVRVALRRWNEIGIEDYRLSVDKECYCDRSAVPETVEALFERAASATETRPDGFVALYDPHTGLPTYLHVDPRSSSVDDEVTLRVTRLEVVAPAPATTGSVEGRLFEPGGDGVGDVAVTLVRGGAPAARASTDASGGFRLETLESGVYQLQASRTGYHQLSIGPLIAVLPGQTTTSEWPLVPDRLVAGSTSTPGRPGRGGEVVGQVISTDGYMVPGVTVTLRGGETRTASTDLGGRYAFSDLPDDEYRLEAELAGFRMFRGAASPLDRVISVRSGRRLDVGVLVFAGIRGDGTEADRARRIEELDAMMTRWQAARPDAYEWTVQRGSGRYARLRVAGRVATFAGNPDEVRDEVEGQEGYYELYLHADQLFETVARAIDWRPDVFEVEYDDSYGFPFLIRVDVGRGVHDDLDISVAGFRPLEGGGY